MNKITTHNKRVRIGEKEASIARNKKQSFIVKLAVLITILFTSVMFSLQAQVSVSGSTGANGLYTSLTRAGGAFAAINASAQTGNNILITITSNSLTEDGANGLGAGAWTSLTIRPTGTREVSGTVNAPLIDLDGADNVTIEGRISGIGTTKSLTIANYSTGTSAATIRFINSAENNLVRYSIVKGAGTSSSSSAVIYLATSTAGNGNDNNTIDNCNLTNATTRPYNLIYSQGTSTRENDNTTISNNNLFDFFNDAASSQGILISAFTGDVSITGNSFYETTTLNLGSFSYACIFNQLALITANTTVTGNYIGGSAPLCGGTPFTLNGTGDSNFEGINISRGSSSIQNNTIRNISWTANQSSDITFNCISVTAAGTHNVGTSQGNTIGATTGTGSIVVTNTGGTSLSSTFAGIQAMSSTGTLNIQNNNIGAITTVGGAVNGGFTFYGINKGSSAVTNISNNLIGSLTTANSVQATGLSSGTDQDVQGIRINSGATSNNTISSNTIANLTNFGTRAGGTVTGGMRGISISSLGGAVTITNNTIRDLSTSQAPTGATTASGASCVGISQGATSASTVQSVQGNTIYNLTNTNTGANAVKVYGILFDGNLTGAHSVSNNLIYNISSSASSATAEIGGIRAITGTTTYYNNIVLIGANQNNSTPLVYGIVDGAISAGSVSNIYFNTVFLSGATTAGSTLSTAFRGLSAGTKNYRNNVFVNARSNSGTASGAHFAAHYNNTTNLTSNYNDYFVSGTGGVLGFLTANQTTLIAFRTATSQDANSLNTNPNFANAGGTAASDYLPGASLPGVAGTGITTDFLGSTRITPIMGSVEFAVLPVQLVSFKVKAENQGNKLTWITASEKNNAYFEVQKSDDAKSFTAITRIAGNGTTNTKQTYSFTDINPTHSTAYYRLKQVDYDGNTHYSAVVVVRGGEETSSFEVKAYPNPAQHQFSLTGSENVVAVKVYNGLGQCVYATEKAVGETMSAINVSDWNKGVYRISVTSTEGETKVLSLVK